VYTARQAASHILNETDAAQSFAVGPSWSHQQSVNRLVFRLFTEECAKFKNLIHVNSFVHDFHLRRVGFNLNICRETLF
jgi:hypothetical protein